MNREKLLNLLKNDNHPLNEKVISILNSIVKSIKDQNLIGEYALNFAAQSISFLAWSIIKRGINRSLFSTFDSSNDYPPKIKIRKYEKGGNNEAVLVTEELDIYVVQMKQPSCFPPVVTYSYTTSTISKNTIIDFDFLHELLLNLLEVTLKKETELAICMLEEISNKGKFNDLILYGKSTINMMAPLREAQRQINQWGTPTHNIVLGKNMLKKYLNDTYFCKYCFDTRKDGIYFLGMYGLFDAYLPSKLRTIGDDDCFAVGIPSTLGSIMQVKEMTFKLEKLDSSNYKIKFEYEQGQALINAKAVVKLQGI